MSDGFFIRFREMVPEEGLLNLALAEISSLHESWPERLQCNIVLAHEQIAPEGQYAARVELQLAPGTPLESRANSADPYAALRTAFHSLRQRLPMVA